MFSAYSFAQWGRPANCLFPMRRQLSRHSEEAGWKPRKRHFPKYTRKDMKVTGADPTQTCFAATLTDWRTPKGNGCKPSIVLLECGPRGPGGGMADAVDSKSTESNLMRVQLPPRAPNRARWTRTAPNLRNRRPLCTCAGCWLKPARAAPTPPQCHLT